MSRGALVRLFHGSCGVLILLSSAAAQDPVYRAGFITSLDRTPYYLAPDGAAPGLAITEGFCVPRTALPGGLRKIPVWSTLTTPSVSPLERIHGWSISLRAEGARILVADSMFPGKAEFERTEVTSGAGNEGAVSTVILSSGFPGETAVSGGRFPIAFVGIEVTVPSEGCAETTLRYEDGLLDSKGIPVVNRILSTAPTSLELQACSTSICAIPANTEICDNARDDDADGKVDLRDPDCRDFSEGCFLSDCGCSPSFDLFFTNEKTQWKPPPGSTLTLSSSSRQTALAITNSVPLAGFELSGRTLLGEGRFTLELTGDVADEKGRTVRNVFLDALGNRIPPSVLNDLSTPHGHIAAVERAPDLAPFDATSFLTFDFESGPSGSSFWVRYLADPASAVALIPPHTERGCANNRILTVTFGPPFHRGDANGDGILDLADAVAVLLRLFGAGDPLACLEAANSNDDGDLNIADPVHILNHLFLGGSAPPDPGPPGMPCGADGPMSQSFLGCDAYFGCGG